jgi:hypothetical protein
MRIVKSIVIVVTLSLAWVLATQDRVAVFDIGPTVDLPEMHYAHDHHQQREQASRLLVKSAAIVCHHCSGSGDGGNSVVIAVAPATIAPCLPSEAFVWARLECRPPRQWHRGNPSTGPPVLA